jgi:hypothetical protein
MPPTPAQPPDGPGFVETSEIQFEFSNGGDEAERTDQPEPDPSSESDVEGTVMPARHGWTVRSPHPRSRPLPRTATETEAMASRPTSSPRHLPRRPHRRAAGSRD